ncbi:hypothetical protein D3OALGA1CA_4516 [Olavius algarvensis associated proteobacterium Delta 3]|nr:hypothetical protein D3OALGB2SA_2379 [Olavius algarvensis associated proteobacterium Delta 3]CAB5152554.1 hypothetical protein D3OALGA1CA_4516 [Olavius algarvensis associated proteobacterium Delta 3]
MNTDDSRMVLNQKKALVAGIATEHSIAYGYAGAFREPGGVSPARPCMSTGVSASWPESAASPEALV